MPSRSSLSLLLVAIVALVASGCGAVSSSAIEVGDTEVSHGDLMTELEQLAGNQIFAEQLLGLCGPASPSGAGCDELRSNGAFEGQFARAVIQNRLVLTATNLLAEERGIEPDDRVRQELEQQATVDGQSAFELFSDQDFADRLRDDYARQFLLLDELQEQFTVEIAELLEDAAIDSRYGEWNSQSRIVDAPLGPREPVTLDAGAELDG